MVSELHSLNLKLCSKQYNEKIVLHLIVAPQLSNGWWHNYSTKTMQVGQANEQSKYSLISMELTYLSTNIEQNMVCNFYLKLDLFDSFVIPSFNLTMFKIHLKQPMVIQPKLLRSSSPATKRNKGI